MKILYTCDDNYIWIMGVSLLSLYESNRHMKELEVYLIGDQISKVHKEQIRGIAERYDRCFHFVDVPEIYHNSLNVLASRWPLSAYIRLFAGELLPPEVDRVLYIDCDTIVMDRLDDLDGIDMKQKIFCGVKDCIGGLYKQNIGLEKDSIYLNAGVLLINLDELRTINMKKQIDAFIGKFGLAITYADQDILNGAFKNRIGCLPLRYNLMTIMAVYPYRTVKLLRRPTCFYSEIEQNEAVKLPCIVHYTTNMETVRPWYSNTNHPFAEVFRHYLSISPWSEDELPIMHYRGGSAAVIHCLNKLPDQMSVLFLGMLHSVIRPVIIKWRAILHNKCYG